MSGSAILSVRQPAGFQMSGKNSRLVRIFRAHLAFGFFFFLSTLAFSQTLSPPASPPDSQVRPSIARPEIGFAAPQKLNDHYRKHGREFGKITKEEYLRLAQELRDRPAGGDILEAVRKDGVVTRLDRKSGAFLACNPDGTIRTFFKPSDGEKYFWRQARRNPKKE